MSSAVDTVMSWLHNEATRRSSMTQRLETEVTYYPKAGDRVTSPQLVGEWVVQNNPYDGTHAKVMQDSTTTFIDPKKLTLVSPPKPPEPAPGEVVFAHGNYWQHGEGRWGTVKANGDWAVPGVLWEAIVDDAEPVVPVTRVVNWMEDNYAAEWTQKALISAFLDEFSWPRRTISDAEDQ